MVVEIRGPCYHCLRYQRDLHRGKECPLDCVHSLHTPNIGLSIFCSLCCRLTDIFIHIFEKVCTCLSLPLCNQYNGNVLTSKQKRKKNCFDKPNLNKSKQESRCSSTSIMQLCVSACFCHIYNMVQCEGTFSLSTAVKASPCSW